MVIPSDFENLATIADAESLLNKYNINLYQTITHFPAQITELPPDFVKYVQKAYTYSRSKENYPAVCKITATMMEENIRLAAPQRAQLLLCGKPILTKIKAFMLADGAVAFLEKNYAKYLPKHAGGAPVEELKMYQSAVIAFREMLKKEKINIPEAPVLSSHTITKLNVGDLKGLFMIMLDDMIEKRNRRLTAPGQEQTGTGAGHMEDYIYALSSSWDEPILWPEKKLTTGETEHEGKERKEKGFAWKWEKEPGTKAKLVPDPDGRALRLSSALAKDKQLNPNSNWIEKIKNFQPTTEDGIKNHKKLLRAAMEAETMLESTGGTGGEEGYSQQLSNIDPIFFTFFIIFKICDISIEEFYQFQRVIYLVCRSVRGAYSIIDMLKNFRNVPGIGTLIANYSHNRHIYSPPWIFHINRIYDISATIGGCDTMNVKGSVSKPAMSWRSFLMIDYSKINAGLKFIVSLFQIENYANSFPKTQENEEDIYQSEHILHQLLVGRNSPLANTNLVKGNALKVELVGDVGQIPPLHQKTLAPGAK